MESLSKEEIIKIIQNDDDHTIKNCIKNGFGINKLIPSVGFTLLQIASQNGALKIIKLAVENGAKIDLKLCNETPLYYAVDNEHIESVKFLLKSGANPNSKFSPDYEDSKWTPLMLCINRRQKELIQILIEFKPDVCAVSKFGKSAVTLAAEKNDLNLVKNLLELGAPVLTNDLICAIYYAENPEMVSLLLSRGADPNAVVKKHSIHLDFHIGEPALTFCMMLSRKKQIIHEPNEQYHKIFEMLLEAGADANKIFNCRTQLSWAILADDLDFVRKLLKFGASPRGESLSIIGKGATKNKPTLYETGLHQAIHSKNYEIIKLLLEAGADLLEPDENGVSPLGLAVQNKDVLDIFEKTLDSSYLSPLLLNERKRQAEVHSHGQNI